MKPNLKNSGMLYRSALFGIIALASPNRATALDISGDTVVVDLTVNRNTTGTGWGLFKTGVYFGPTSEAMLSWNADPLYPTTTGTVLFDIVRPKGSFTWRQSPTGGTAVNKMSIDENNILTLYKAPKPAGTTPAAGVTINPETGVINLTGTGTTSGITYNGTSLFSLDSTTGKITFASNRPAVIGSLAASTGSTSGALVVRGGIGVGQDSYFNGVKIGRGASGSGSFSNLAVGTVALNTSGTGAYNSAIGNGTLYSNSSGSYNSALGQSALGSNTSGNSNTALGYCALNSATTGGNNASLGANAGYYNISGSSNVFLGSWAGAQDRYYYGVTAPQNSIYIGANSRGYSSADSNSIVIGADAVGEGTNTTVIGNSSTQKAVIYGRSVSLAGGTVTSDFAVAINGGVASQYGATGIGGSATSYSATAIAGGVASGTGSTAISSGVASGGSSTAIAGGVASGNSSFAVGNNTKATSVSSVAFGRYNTTWGNAYAWIETDPLMIIGNGIGSTTLSNAITTLKNGRTTLSNRGWNATPREAPSSTNSNGEALVVEGNTVLKGDTRLEGKVTISVPQGDISMGIYGN